MRKRIYDEEESGRSGPDGVAKHDEVKWLRKTMRYLLREIDGCSSS